MILKILFLIFVVLVSGVNSAELWVNPTGSATSPYETKAKGLTTIQAGLTAMSGGDTLYITDGTYVGTSNMITAGDIPAGNYGPDTTDRTEDDVWTIVQAETDFGVTIDAEAASQRVPIRISTDYIYFRGVIACNSGDNESNQAATPFNVTGDNIKVIRCGAYDAGQQAVDFSTSEMSNVLGIGGGASYVLFEECFAWGWGKYVINTYLSDHIIFRRCVARQDGWARGFGSCFQVYSSSYVEIQNCIAIDFDEPRHWHPQGNDYLWGAFHMNGTSDYAYMRGCIAMNIQGPGSVQMKDHEGNNVGADYEYTFWTLGNNNIIEHCLTLGSTSAFYSDNGDTWNNISAIDINLDATLTADGKGLRGGSGSGDPTVTDSLFFECAVNGVENLNTVSDYNCYYGNANNYSGCTYRANDLSSENSSAIDPEANGLLYPVRIESGSTLKTAGSGGGQIGAEIMKKYGTDGTLYGESGYNTLTAVDLWPFPNEAIIKAKMSVYDRVDPYDSITPDTPVDGDRGFCADGETLTKYIWEYLGNTIPSDIYGNYSTTCGAGTDLRIGAETQLTWGN